MEPTPFSNETESLMPDISARPLKVAKAGAAFQMAEGAPAILDVSALAQPCGSKSVCRVERKGEECIAMYDSGDNFVAVARLFSKKPKSWKFYTSPDAVALDSEKLTKAHGYIGKLAWGSMVPTLQKFTLEQGNPQTGGHTPVMEVTMNFHTNPVEGLKWVCRWKVRLAHETGQIFRCAQPLYAPELKSFSLPGMSIPCISSVKNIRLVRDLTAAQQGGEHQNEGATEDYLLEMGKTADDVWQMNMQSSLSPYQALGLAVCSIFQL
jgi:hypothetical protein